MIKNCNNCLCHLKVCQAECCKEFSLIIPKTQRIYKGMIIRQVINDPDLINYYKLHGIKFEGKIGIFKLFDYKRDGEILTLYMRCNALTEQNLCSLHNTNQQPKVCHYPNKKGIGANVYLTQNCLFKKKVVK
ncbi:MAG: hypothetical protein EOL97_16960 [Spirochaetia bacterium]|nr:hypothetical protein [Spirochaetia bacterium]